MAASHSIKTVAVIGTGVIGASWVSLFLSKGLTVYAIDPAPGAENRLREFIKNAWPALESIGLSASASMDNLHFTRDIKDAVGKADFIQENGPEDKNFKEKLFADLDSITPKTTILASSSSGIPPSAFIGKCTNCPNRVIVGHPFNPPHIIPLVEIVPSAKTDQQTVKKAQDFYQSLGKTPVILKKEVKGFIANRLQAALCREVFSLVTEGVCSAADIDKAITQGPGLRWALLGPYVDLKLAGGKGGVQHSLEHLGPAMQSWIDDFKPFSLSDKKTRSTLAQKTDEVTKDLDMNQAVKDRDEMLISIIKAKRERTSFPA